MNWPSSTTHDAPFLRPVKLTGSFSRQINTGKRSERSANNGPFGTTPSERDRAQATAYEAGEKEVASSDRDGLHGLSPIQFEQLCTDVFDEMARRRRLASGGNARPSTPFLLLKSSFHPKRNTARRKLSTLPLPRFHDLATDILNEQGRRIARLAEDGNEQRATSSELMRGMANRTAADTDSSRAYYQLLRSSQVSLAASCSEGDSASKPRIEATTNTLAHRDGELEEELLNGRAKLQDRLLSYDGEGQAGDLRRHKAIIEGYLSQLTDLREELELIERNLKWKRDDLCDALPGSACCKGGRGYPSPRREVTEQKLDLLREIIHEHGKLDCQHQQKHTRLALP